MDKNVGCMKMLIPRLLYLLFIYSNLFSPTTEGTTSSSSPRRSTVLEDDRSTVWSSTLATTEVYTLTSEEQEEKSALFLGQATDRRLPEGRESNSQTIILHDAASESEPKSFKRLDAGSQEYLNFGKAWNSAKLKREANFNNFKGPVKIKSIKRIARGVDVSRILHWNTIAYNGRILVCYSTLKDVVVLQLSKFQIIRQASQPGHGACQFGVMKNGVFLFHMQHSENSKPRAIVSKLIVKENVLEKWQTLSIRGDSKFTFWKYDGRYFLMATTFTGNSDIFWWVGSKFEHFQILPVGSFQIPQHLQVANDSYIAVIIADKQDDFLTYMKIYKYLPTHRTYVATQKIVGRTQTSVTTLRTPDGQVFLLVTSFCSLEPGELCGIGGHCVVYKFTGGEFVEFQSLASPGAISSAVLRIQSEVFLVVLSALDGVTLYQYDGRFSKVSIDLDDELMEEGLTDLLVFAVNDEIALGVRSLSEESESSLLFGVNLEATYLSGDEADDEVILEKCLKMLELLNGVAKVPISVEDATEEYLNSIKEIKEEIFYSENEDEILELDSKLDILQQNLTLLEQRMDMVERKISNSINITEKSTWPDNLEMSSIVLLDVYTVSFFARYVNGKSVPSLDQLIPFDQSSLFIGLGTKTFSNIETPELLVENLNGIPLSSYLTLSGDHLASVHISFENLWTQSLKVGGFVDGVEISKERMLLNTSGQHIFHGSMLCSELIVQSLQVDFINDVNVKKLIENSFQNQSTWTLEGDLHINGDLKVRKNLQATSVMGRKLENYAKDVFLLNSTEQLLTGRYNIDSATVSELHLDQKLNSIEFWDKVFINLPVKFYHLPQARFDHLHAGIVTVDGRINEIKVSDKELDLVPLEQDQIINGSKTFVSIHLGNSLTYKTASDLYKNLESPRMGNILKVYHSSLKSNDSLESLVSNLNYLSLIRAYLIKLTDTKPLLLLPSNFSDIRERFVPLSNVYSTIAKLMPILDSVNEQKFGQDHRLMKKLIQSFNINEEIISLRILRTFKAVPKSSLDFVQEFYDKLSKASRKIENLIAWNKRAISALNITGEDFSRTLRQNFNKYGVEKMFSMGSKVTGRLAHLDLNEAEALKNGDRPIIDREVIINKVKEADNVIFMGNLVASGLNNVMVEDILRRPVPLQATNTHLSLVFEEGVVIQGDLKTSIFNDHIVSNLAKVNETNVFTRGSLFKNIRCLNNIQVKGKVNGFDLKEASDITSVLGSRAFSSPIKFKEAIVTSLKAKNVMLGDVQLEDVVLKHESKVSITGKKKFRGLSVSGPLTIIDDLNTKELNTIKLTESPDKRTVTQNMKFKGKIKVEMLSVKGNIVAVRELKNSVDQSSIDLTSLYDETIQRNRPVSLTGPLTLTGNVTANNLVFKKDFNGITAKEFNEGWVTDDYSQVIRGVNVFKNLRVKNLTVKNKVVQGINIEDLAEKTVKVDENAAFEEMVYLDDARSLKSIEIDGLVQGWNLTKDAVLKSEPGIITSPKRFLSPVYIKGNIDVDGLVNGMDLGAICKSIMGQVVIKGNVYFEKDVHADSVQSEQVIFPDGKDYWKINEAAVFQAPLVFAHFASKSIQIIGKLNGEDMTEIIEGPIPKDCNGKVKLGRWSADMVTCRLLFTRNMTTARLGDEDGGILKRVIMDKMDQEFGDHLKIQDLLVTGSLNIGKTLNGYSPSDFCFPGFPCVIEAEKGFKSVTIDNAWDIEDRSYVNNLAIGDVKSASAFSNLTVLVKGDLQVDDLRVNGLVNGIHFDSNSVLSLSKNQNIDGSLVIDNPKKMALRIADVKILDGKINDMRVDALEFPQINMKYNDSSIRIQSLLERYKQLGAHISAVHSTLLAQPVTFDGWKIASVFRGSTRVVPLDASKDTYLPFVALLNDGEVRLSHYSSIDKQIFFVTIDVNCATDAVGFEMNDQLFVAVSTNCPNPNMNFEGVSIVSPEDTALEEQIYSFIWRVSANGAYLHTAIATGKASQVLWLKAAGRNCILFVSKSSRRQNIICQDKTSLILQQSLLVGGVVQAVAINPENSERTPSLLILGTTGEAGERVNILEYDYKTAHYHTLQKLRSDGLLWLSAIKLWDELFLAIVHRPFADSLQGTVKVFRLNKSSNNCRLELQESILITEPIQTTFMESPTDELYLLVLSERGFINRYVGKRFSKFQEAGSLFVPGARNLLYWSWDRDGRNLAISKTNEYDSNVLVLQPQFKGLLENLDLH